MANPTGVTAGTLITETWGDAVVSRVVGIYASTAAAETDGRTEAGAVIALSDGTVWVKVTTTSGNWARLHTLAGFDEPSDITPGTTSWNDFGSVTIAAGTARSMHCIAQASFTVSSVTTANVEAQIQISRDGGSAYAGGSIQYYDSVAANKTISLTHMRTIAPTGDWVAKLRVKSNQTDTTWESGIIIAQVLPNLT